MIGTALAERGLLPRPVALAGRRHFRARLRSEALRHADGEEALARLVGATDSAEVAPSPRAAHRQHGEVPSAFSGVVVGRNRNYSAGPWEPGAASLDEAEEATLELAGARARLRDGPRVLELGCGWGSLSLWMAERWPGSRITIASNPRSQGPTSAPPPARAARQPGGAERRPEPARAPGGSSSRRRCSSTVVAGMALEAVADAQLAQFLERPGSRGQVMQVAVAPVAQPQLPRRPRGLAGLGLPGASAGAPVTLLGPRVMSVLLLRVSGVTLPEKAIGERRNGHADGAAPTSAFLPLPPRTLRS